MGHFSHRKPVSCTSLVCVVAFSGFVRLNPVREATTRNTTMVLRDRMFTSFAILEVFVFDKAKYYVSRKVKKFCFKLRTKHMPTVQYTQPSCVEM